MWLWFHKLGSPKLFWQISSRLIPWFGSITALLIVAGLYLGLFVAPPDYQQGEAYRIIFIHVPSGWMSMFIYMVMASSAAIGLIWKMKLADSMATASAPIGASFALLTLMTGSLWGKPMWGTWWEWDARMTSELILLFLYLGFIALQAAIDDRRTAARAGAVLAIVGAVNVPIIHFSVEWWNTLHQPATITKLGVPSIDISMLIPLLLMAVGFTLFYLTMVLVRTRCELLASERNTAWVKELVLELVPENSGQTASNKLKARLE